MIGVDVTITDGEAALEVCAPYSIEPTPLYTLIFHPSGGGSLNLLLPKEVITRLRNLITTCLDNEARQRSKATQIADLERQIAELKRS